MVFPRTIVFGNDSILWHSTLWSVVCEEIYYAIYPLLNRLSAQTGWVNIIKATFITSILISGYFYEAVEWQDIGVVATAVTLFPVWLLGCYLAEHVSELKKVCSARRIWLWRVTAVVAMWMALVLHFHLGIHQTQTGLWIGVLYYFWIREELSYYRTRSPWNLLIWGGRWSYSLYLTHPIIVAVCLKYGVKAYASRLDWLVVIALVFIASYTFYLVVERPTHNQARKISLFSRGRRILPTTAAGAH
jgi:peptidoglycan/LPS O-acetylase OafA/YrhL